MKRMGFFDSLDYSAANDVDSFTRSVHSLLNDLYQSNPLQSGTLDKVVSVPDLKPIEVPAGLSAPQQSGLLSRSQTSRRSPLQTKADQ